ncbi:MAG: hypothetical protein CMJ19_12400 [Phycisphaeraceae bacterium]|nr:hypothetical protein [Phycisphaeraceae bacterium]
MSASDPQIERELELGLFPGWIDRAVIDDTKRFWSPKYKYALSDSEAIEILRNVKALGDLLIKTRHCRSATASAVEPETAPVDAGGGTAQSTAAPDQPGLRPARHKASTSCRHPSTDRAGTVHNGGTPSWSASMNATTPEFEADCRSHLDRFFAAYPDATMEKRAHKALRLLRASEKPIKGKAEGWAAGIIYAVGTYDRPPVGVPNVLNSEFEKLMGVSMGTARNRAAAVREFMTL